MRALVISSILLFAVPVQAASFSFSVTIDSVDSSGSDLFPAVDVTTFVGERGVLSVTFDENNLDTLPNQGGSLLRLGVPELPGDFDTPFGDIFISLDVAGRRGTLVGNLDGPTGLPVATFEFFPGDRLIVTEDDFDGALRLDVSGVPLPGLPLVALDTRGAMGSFTLFDQGGLGLSGTVIPQPVPEPSSVVLLGIGGLIVGAAVRRKRRS